jgi:hypothetical protein
MTLDQFAGAFVFELKPVCAESRCFITIAVVPENALAGWIGHEFRNFHFSQPWK